MAIVSHRVKGIPLFSFNSCASDLATISFVSPALERTLLPHKALRCVISLCLG